MEASDPREEASRLLSQAATQLHDGRLDRAGSLLDRALALDDQLAEALSLRAFVFMRQGQPRPALDTLERLLTLRPGRPGDWHNRAVLLTALGRHREAVTQYEAVLAQEPDHAGSHQNLAWLLATSPDPAVRDGPRAVRHAERALTHGETGAWLDTLAAALARAGRFAEAAQTARRAWERSTRKNPRFLERRRLYLEGKPYTTASAEPSAAGPPAT